MNTLLNGVLAIIRNAPERAREYLRQANIASTSDVYVAIVKEVELSNDKAKLDCLRNILRQSLRLTGDQENYVEGIKDVETIIEEEISKIKERTGITD